MAETKRKPKPYLVPQFQADDVPRTPERMAELPGDAVMVVSVHEMQGWQVDSFVYGGATLTEALDLAAAERPNLAGLVILATKIGGGSMEGRVLRVEQQPAPPAKVTLEPLPEQG